MGCGTRRLASVIAWRSSVAARSACARRLRVISSQVGQVSPSHRPRWSHARRLALALELLADERFEALLSPPGEELRFEDLPTRLPAILLGSADGPPTPVVVY